MHLFKSSDGGFFNVAHFVAFAIEERDSLFDVCGYLPSYYDQTLDIGVVRLEIGFDNLTLAQAVLSQIVRIATAP